MIYLQPRNSVRSTSALFLVQGNLLDIFINAKIKKVKSINKSIDSVYIWELLIYAKSAFKHFCAVQYHHI